MICDDCGTGLLVYGSRTLEVVGADGEHTFFPAYMCYCPDCGKRILIDQGQSLEG